MCLCPYWLHSGPVYLNKDHLNQLISHVCSANWAIAGRPHVGEVPSMASINRPPIPWWLHSAETSRCVPKILPKDIHGRVRICTFNLVSYIPHEYHNQNLGISTSFSQGMFLCHSLCVGGSLAHTRITYIKHPHIPLFPLHLKQKVQLLSCHATDQALEERKHKEFHRGVSSRCQAPELEVMPALSYAQVKRSLYSKF